MAKLMTIFNNIFISLTTFFVLFFFSSTWAAVQTLRFSRNISPKTMGLQHEKLTHLHFYFYDIVNGSNPTAIRIAEAPTTNTSSTGFGALVMIDDPLTLGPDPNSKPIGQAQGFYALDSQTESSLLMGVNFVFTEGKYNGSTLSVLGRNKVSDAVREMPVVGGSGVFRFARGYALAKTHIFDLKTGYTVVEYNVYVFHY